MQQPLNAWKVLGIAYLTSIKIQPDIVRKFNFIPSFNELDTKIN